MNRISNQVYANRIYLRNDIVQSVKIYLDEGSAKEICKRVHIIVLILALQQYLGRVLAPEECHHCLMPTKYNQSYQSYLTICYKIKYYSGNTLQ